MKQEFNFKIEGIEWEKLQDKAFEKLNKTAKIDGFRAGKAPRKLYEKAYGEQKILYEAADEAVKNEYERIINEEKVIPVIEPSIDIITCDNKILELKIVFVTEPKVTLGEYKNLGVKKEKVKVTKAEVKERIDSLLNDYAELEIKDGKVENGDIAIIDYTGFKDGVKFDGGTAENYSLTIGSNTFIPGFEEGIIGMSKGEEKDLNLKFPDEYMSEELKGKEVVFKVKVNEIKNRVVPKLDEEFFQDLGMEGINSKESLEHEIEHEIEHQKEHEQEHIYEDKCLEKASGNMKIEICEELINDEIEHMYKEFIERMKMQGIDEDMYFKYTKSTKEDLQKQMKPDAEKRIKYRYLLKEVIKKEKIKVKETELNKRIDEMCKMYNMTKEDILKSISMEEISLDMTYEKALNIVTSNEEKKETKKEEK